MSLGTAIAELQRRFDRLARTKGGNPGTYGTKGGKGQQPKRKNNPAHVAGAIAVLKALSKEVAVPMQVLIQRYNDEFGRWMAHVQSMAQAAVERHEATLCVPHASLWSNRVGLMR